MAVFIPDESREKDSDDDLLFNMVANLVELCLELTPGKWDPPSAWDELVAKADQFKAKPGYEHFRVHFEATPILENLDDFLARTRRIRDKAHKLWDLARKDLGDAGHAVTDDVISAYLEFGGPPRRREAGGDA